MKNCDNCMHSEVCKFKVKFQKIVATMTAELKEQENRLQEDMLVGDISLKDVFNICFDCKHYLSYSYNSLLNRSYDKSLGLGIEPIPTSITYGGSYTADCSSCDFYKAYILGGKMYIGDSPCDWCAKSPSRVTCNDINSTSTALNSVNTKTILNENMNIEGKNND